MFPWSSRDRKLWSSWYFKRFFHIGRFPKSWGYPKIIIQVMKNLHFWVLKILKPSETQTTEDPPWLMNPPDLFPIGTWAIVPFSVSTAKPLPRVSDAGQEASKQLGMIERMKSVDIRNDDWGLLTTYCLIKGLSRAYWRLIKGIWRQVNHQHQLIRAW